MLNWVSGNTTMTKKTAEIIRVENYFGNSENALPVFWFGTFQTLILGRRSFACGCVCGVWNRSFSSSFQVCVVRVSDLKFRSFLVCRVSVCCRRGGDS
ncbi:hypothetical protein LINPERHAP2_LOCUS19304 [Linum perenne]